ncbi:MAG: glycosyltransferase [Micrococcales bacterium]|nr:glycosyltransferase [Micrococcales bacterium]
MVVGDTFAPDINGSASFAKRLAAELTRRGHDVHVVAPSPDGPARTGPETHAGAELTVHRLRSWKWPPHPWIRFALPWRVKANARRILTSVQPDVVHFQSHIVTGAGFAPVAKSRGIRLIGTNHTMPENIAQHVTVLPKPLLDGLVRAQWRSAARIFGLAEQVTSPTQRSADYFERMTGLRGVHAVSNGIDTTQYTPDFAPKAQKRIVFVGRLDDEKHIDELIDATARLDPALDARVDIVGAGEAKHRLQAQAQRIGVADRVAFHGKISDEELRGILTRGTVFAMPSRAELQCIAAMEAMATALPVVGANAMALPHLVHDGENGYLYEPGDIDGLVTGLTKVLTASAEDLERMKRASQEIVTHHSLAHSVDLFERLYRGQPVDAAGAREG